MFFLIIVSILIKYAKKSFVITIICELRANGYIFIIDVEKVYWHQILFLCQTIKFLSYEPESKN
jgi:hypothetical protein